MGLSRILLLTGTPGIGKTTVVQRAANEILARGFKVGGMMTREVREGRTRIGFEIEDLSTSRKGWLARINQPSGPRISKYRVNLKDLEEIGARAIQDAVLQADVIVIDEIGPMELFSQPFKNMVMEAIHSEKAILGTIHHRARGPFIEDIKKRKDVEIIVVTFGNRDRLPDLIIEKIVNAIKEQSIDHR
ncbi:MAG: NTPase [Candidatus Bathyarchaeia archaeon]